MEEVRVEEVRVGRLVWGGEGGGGGECDKEKEVR